MDRVQFPDGRIIDKHHLLDFEKEAVGVLAENAEGQVLLVHVYRYTTDTIEWEIPAGAVEEGESILEAAKREVLEESGYETDDHQLIYSYYPINGISNKVFHIAHCYALRKVADFDRNEVRDFRWVSRQEIERMIRDRLVRDGFTLPALLLYLIGY